MSDDTVRLDATATDDTVAPAEVAQVKDEPELVVVDRRHYHVISEHARGGLGRILRARDRRTGRIVAIKEMLRGGEALVARFAREALVTANLQHPAIVPVYEVGRWSSGEPFYAMKLVAGRSLEDVLDETRTLAERLALVPHAIAVAEAMAYAHGERVIHRDLKPANVLVGAYGETVVVDWGLAKNLATGVEAAALPATGGGAVAGAGETVVGTVMGTPAYMPPEQARGEAVDERADVYALGAILYHLLSGARPYAEVGQARDALARVVEGPPRPLRALVPEVPPELATIVEKAMARRAEDRYPTAKGLAEDLDRFRAGKLVSAHVYSPWQLVARWVRRNRALVAATALFAVLLAGFGVLSVRRIVAERNRAEEQRALATARLAELFEEQGRTRLIDGDAARALPWLAEALARGADRAATRFMLARALEPVATLDRVLTGTSERVFSVAWSRDGRRLLVAGADMVVRVWDVARGEVALTVPFGMFAWWSPDGARVLSILPLGDVMVWDATTGALRRRVALPGGEQALSAVWLPGGGFAVGGRAGTVGVWGEAPEPLVMAASDKPVRALAVDADGELVPRDAIPVEARRGEWSARGDEGVVVLARGGREVARLPAHDGVMAVDFSPDGAWLATGGLDHTVKVWRVAPAGGVRALVGHEGKLNAAALSPDGRVAATASQDGTARLFDGATGEARAVLAGHRGAVTYVALANDGARAVTSGEDGTARIWDVATGAAGPVLAVGGVVRRAVFSPDGRRVLAASGDVATLWDARTGARLAVLAGHSGEITNVRFSPDGRRIVVCTAAVLAHLWDGDGKELIEGVGVSGRRVFDAVFSPDGKRFALTSEALQVPLYETERGAFSAQLVGHTWAVTSVDFSPDGKRLVTSGEDGTVRLWRDDGSAVAQLGRSPRSVISARFSSDGARVVAAGLDGALRTWDVESGRLLASRALGGELYLLRTASSRDAARILVLGDAVNAWLVDGGLYEGDVERLRARVACVSPWRVSGAALVDAVPEVRACGM